MHYLTGKDCWGGCGAKGGPCPQWCGRDGYCCRQGWGGTKDPGCNKAISPCKNFHCCTLIKEPAPPPATEEETKEEEEGKEITNKGKRWPSGLRCQCNKPEGSGSNPHNVSLVQVKQPAGREPCENYGNTI